MRSNRLRAIARSTRQAVRIQTFKRKGGSASYWADRYQAGGNSGVGSYGVLADFKAATLNDFVAANNVGSVIEFGCGDGNQLSLANYPRYLGLDVAKGAIELCRTRFGGDRS